METYKNASAPIAQRVEDLLARLSLEEKVAQLQCMMATGGDPAVTLGNFPHGIGEVAVFGAGGSAAEVAENNRKTVEYVMQQGLGIPPIIQVEALTGLCSPDGTIFPSAIGLGATFAPATVRQMGEIIRGQMLATGYRQALSPVMDVARDPRWGRIGETYGEDPTLDAAMSVAFTKGLQSDDLKDGAVVTGKHFLGYGVSDGGLNMASNPISPRELREVYAKPFQAAITEGGMQSIMNSYGTLDGEMVIASKHIMNDLLREEMAFDGMMVSDYMSINRLVGHGLAANMAEAGVMALKAGLDVECPMPAGYTSTLIDAVHAGTLDEAIIDRAVRRVLETKFKLGLFENPYPRAELFDDAYSNPAWRQHSLQAARQAVVLLKNDGLLPLSKEVKKIAVIGPHGNNVRLMFGGYTYPASMEMQIARSFGAMAGMGSGEGADDGFVQTERMPGSTVLREHPDATAAINARYADTTPTILASIRQQCPGAQVVYAPGCEIAGTQRSLFDEAVLAAKEADVVILTLGGKYGWGSNCTIGEGIDCDDIGLPGVQEELAKEIFATGTPAVLVHMDARPLSSTFIEQHYPAIIENWFPGITGGQALAEVLFGEVNPAGRLPATAARNAGQVPVYSGQKRGNSYYTKPEEVGMVLSEYCGSTKEPLFYFGQGLSYTRFEYSDLQVDATVPAKGSLRVRCKVKNTGSVDGEEVAQLYVTDVLSSMLRPAKELAGFARVPLRAGEEKTLCFTLKADQFAFLNTEMDWVVEAGEMKVAVGGSSVDLPLQGSFTIENSAVVAGHKRGFYARAEIV